VNAISVSAAETSESQQPAMLLLELPLRLLHV